MAVSAGHRPYPRSQRQQLRSDFRGLRTGVRVRVDHHSCPGSHATARSPGGHAGATAFGEDVMIRFSLVLIAVLAGTASAQTRSASIASPNQLTAAERAAGWRLLFDGHTLTGWRGLGYDTVPTAHWVVLDGTIKKIASGNVPRVADGRPLVGGDLMTVDSFADFELSFEWKVTPGANSGVKYNVSEAMSMAQGGAGTQGGPTHSALGFEYQILDDDRHEDGKLPTHRSAALYDLIAPNEKKHLPPVGEWNRSRIVFRGNHGEHWLNGQ